MPMKAAVLHEFRPAEESPLTIEDVPTPNPGPGQVLVKVHACGVCRSNLHMIEGEWRRYGIPSKLPIIPGHEIIGEVVELGEGVEGLRKGARVGIQPIWSSCGRCDYCLRGMEHICPEKKLTGEHVDGGYAEYIVADARHVYEVPDNLSPEEAAPLFCPGITAYGAVMKADLRPGMRVGVFGVGGVGHMVIQLALLHGADVVAVSRRENHLRVAERLGAKWLINSSEKDPVEEIRRIGGLDVSIVFAPSSKVAEQAFKSTKLHGTVVIGVHVELGWFPFYEEKRVVGTVVGPRWAMREVVRLASEGKLKVIHEDYPLEKANEVLRKLKHGEVDARAVLIP